MKYTAVVWVLAIIMLCAMTLPARAGGILFTPEQIAAAREARTVGTQYGIPRLLVAIIWHESSFCSKPIGDDDRSFGCGQVQLHTAEFISGHPVSRYDLIHDRALNLNLAARYLQYCLVRFGFERGIYCYNHGAPRAATATDRMVATNQYVARVLTLFGNVGDLLAVETSPHRVRIKENASRPPDVYAGILSDSAGDGLLPTILRPHQDELACTTSGAFQWLRGSA